MVEAKDGFVFNDYIVTGGPAPYQWITVSTASGASLLYTPTTPSANMFNANLYLGRASSGYSRIIYLNSYLDANVAAAGWKSTGRSVLLCSRRVQFYRLGSPELSEMAPMVNTVHDVDVELKNEDRRKLA
ncbi:hypothetical protein HDU86_006616 [Geranomyces michiganensis]|nr:hypothetical protein HDU86_006616 [Geranomyces michiganensis]